MKKSRGVVVTLVLVLGGVLIAIFLGAVILSVIKVVFLGYG